MNEKQIEQIRKYIVEKSTKKHVFISQKNIEKIISEVKDLSYNEAKKEINKKINETIKYRINRLLFLGHSYDTISKAIHVSKSTISRIKKEMTKSELEWREYNKQQRLHDLKEAAERYQKILNVTKKETLKIAYDLERKGLIAHYDKSYWEKVKDEIEEVSP
jgi:AraC-like DNA-binding protein